MNLCDLCVSFASFALKLLLFLLLTASPPHCSSFDVQHRLAGELAVDQAAGDRADLAPLRLDRDLRPQFPGGDQLGQKAEADAGALDAHQLVEQGEPVKPRPAGAEQIAALEGHAGRIRYAE